MATFYETNCVLTNTMMVQRGTAQHSTQYIRNFSQKSIYLSPHWALCVAWLRFTISRGQHSTPWFILFKCFICIYCWQIMKSLFFCLINSHDKITIIQLFWGLQQDQGRISAQWGKCGKSRSSSRHKLLQGKHSIFLTEVTFL